MRYNDPAYTKYRADVERVNEMIANIELAISKQLFTHVDAIVANGNPANHKRFKKHPQVTYLGKIYRNEEFYMQAITKANFSGFQGVYFQDGLQSQKYIFLYTDLTKLNEALEDTQTMGELLNI
jgi:hypothetical protein